MTTIPPGKKLVLFDGICNLCNASVRFILKRDIKKQFVFGSLQGEAGQAYLKKFNLPAGTFNSFMLVENDRLYSRSTGALRVLKTLGNGWQILYAFIIIPKFIRDGVYHIISRNRYKWFGKKEVCWMPGKEWDGRFLE